MSSGLRWTQAELDARLAQNRHLSREDGVAPIGRKNVAQCGEPVAEIKKGVVRQMRAKEPNKTEREYERMLKAQYPDAVIRWEAYTLRLASRVAYTPDFSVLHRDGSLDLHEVKGKYVFPKALVKPRICAQEFHHRFVLAQKLKDGWKISVIPGQSTRLNPTD